MRFRKLLEPGYIGRVQTRNRIIKPGAAMLYWNEQENRLNPRVRYFYEALAKGGVGLIVVEAPIIDYPKGARWRRRYRFDSDVYLQGMAELAALIHNYGCPVFMQMNHDGPWQSQPWGDPEPLLKERPIAASSVAVTSDNDFHNELPRPLEVEEIKEIVAKFIRAAERAREAGFDGMDINASSSHLLHNFLSPFWNRRNDEYGGDVYKRARLLLEITKGIKRQLGDGFAVMVTINGFEVGRLAGIQDEGCLSLEQSITIAKLLAEAGADALQVRTHWIGYHAAGFFPEALFYPEPLCSFKDFPYPYRWKDQGKGAHIPLVAEIKRHVSIPVVVVGRVPLEMAEEALRQNLIDFVALNRALLADPQLPNKIATGRVREIAPCTACHTCLEPLEVKKCRINPALGEEEDYSITPATHKKKVLVIGGGPAGMEAARVAAERGHEVYLYEQFPKLGGALLLAAVLKNDRIEDLLSIIGYYENRLKSLGVAVRCGKKIGVEDIDRIAPDVIIMATGAEPPVHKHGDVKGLACVLDVATLYKRLRFLLRFLHPKAVQQLTRLYLPIARDVVIVGGGKRACELAEFLVKRKRRVTIVTSDKDIGAGMVTHLRNVLIRWFMEKGVRFYTEVKEIRIVRHGVRFLDRDGVERLIKAKHVIPLGELVPCDELYEALSARGKEVYKVGDCHKPGEIIDAVYDAYRLVKGI